jgi:hypothetical protein
VPSPEPEIDVTVIVPTPEPFPTPIVNLPAADPWAWSLDAVVALTSGVVAILAILVTVAIAAVDHRRQRRIIDDERSRRQRAERKVVAEAASAYINSIDLEGAAPGTHDRLVRAFADTDIEEEPLYRWIVETGQTRFEAQFAAHEEAPDPDSGEQPKPSWFAYLAIDADVTERLRGWVRTGQIDSSPVRTLAEVLQRP